MRYVVLIISIIGMILFMPNFSNTMNKRSLTAKLGFVPQGKLYKAVIGEFRWFEGEYYTFKSIIYYGGKSKDIAQGRFGNVEYYNLYRVIEASIILNPYNEDAYYFAQAAFTWDVRKVKASIKLLEYVYKYRRWDFQIPFFLGFDYAYFLHDYTKAAKYFKEAANLTHAPLFVNLAARYFYEGGQTKAGIIYLKYMISTAKNENIKKIYKRRLDALMRIEFLENAVNQYEKRFNKKPENLKELIDKGIIKTIPQDPYGGKFYLDKQGKVKTTSKLAKGRKDGNNRGKKSN